MRNDYNKNISRSNNTCNSNSSIGSTRNRSNSNRSDSNSSSNSNITAVLVVLPICSSERDATLAFFRKTKCLRIFRNRTFAVARVTHEGRARLARQRVPDLFLENKRNAATCSV